MPASVVDYERIIDEEPAAIIRGDAEIVVSARRDVHVALHDGTKASGVESVYASER